LIKTKNIKMSFVTNLLGRFDHLISSFGPPRPPGSTQHAAHAGDGATPQQYI